MSTLSLSKVLNSEAGWYRGDFHAHTNASDGVYPPALVAAIAQVEGLDFVAITDHNTIEALAKLSQSSGLLIVPGIEVTLDGGDFNVFGITGWCDWMEGICVGQAPVPLCGRYRTVTELMRRIAADGLLSSINHPLLEPWEWRYAATDLSCVHCLEIWNDPYWPDNVHANPQAVALWTAWLNAGFRITAIGGSDYHCPPRPEEGEPGMRLGLPSTYVAAEELSVMAILEGLRRHRAYVSVGPRLTFQARYHDIMYGIGDDLGQQRGEIEFMATLSDGPAAAYARIVKNGEVLVETLIRGGGGSLEYAAVPDRDYSGRSASLGDWYRLDVLDQNGHMLAITNPIFAGRFSVPRLHKYGDFVDLPDGRDGHHIQASSHLGSTLSRSTQHKGRR
ncbi:MAG: hypothetical protein Kow0063_15230 [Anaerolineae bacterium]